MSLYFHFEGRVLVHKKGLTSASIHPINNDAVEVFWNENGYEQDKRKHTFWFRNSYQAEEFIKALYREIG